MPLVFYMYSPKAHFFIMLLALNEFDFFVNVLLVPVAEPARFIVMQLQISLEIYGFYGL